MAKAAQATWQRHVARWRSSGETAAVFAAREGIKVGTLRWWSSRLLRDAATAADQAPVPMVQLVRVPSKTRSTGVIVDLTDVRARVLVEPGFDRETFVQVLETLGRVRA